VLWGRVMPAVASGCANNEAMVCRAATRSLRTTTRALGASVGDKAQDKLWDAERGEQAAVGAVMDAGPDVQEAWNGSASHLRRSAPVCLLLASFDQFALTPT
jgi:hypothetical protein